jgi:hypothetical protein
MERFTVNWREYVGEREVFKYISWGWLVENHNTNRKVLKIVIGSFNITGVVISAGINWIKEFTISNSFLHEIRDFKKAITA